MFNGLYDLMNKLKKKPLSEKVALQKNATPILSAEDLLSGEKRQQILSDIRTLLNLPDEEYNKIFLTVIHQFALFVQNLPETERSFYASLGGMIDHALERASLSLFLARTYLLPEGSTLSSVSEEEMLWVYAIFTASLLLDVGKIPTRHVVSLSDAAGNIIESWHPYAGAMQIKDNKTHYLFGFMDDHNDHLRWQVTPLLARQIIPADGFNWLSSNEEVLQAWIGLLSDDQTEMGWLKVIPLADAQILESYFTDRKVFRHSLSSQTIAIIHKIIKEKKDAQKHAKEIGERILNEHAQKSDATFATKSDDSKANKQSLFGLVAASELSKIKTDSRDSKADAKDVVKQFVDWIKKETSDHQKGVEGKAEVLNTSMGALITQDILNKFVSENKSLGVNPAQVQSILSQQQIASPVQLAQQTGLITAASMTINPYIVYPSGVPPVAVAVQVFPPSAVVDVAGPREIAAKAEQTVQAQATHTPYNITPKR
jgi:integrating conjugative element relaxase (TIGR03760 family)